MTDRKGLADRLTEAIKASRELTMPQVALSMTDAFAVLEALRQEPSVEATHETDKGARFKLQHEKPFREVVRWLAGEIEAAERGKSTTRAQRKRFAKDEAVNRLAQAIAALYRGET